MQNDIERIEHELDEGIGRLYQVIHIYEPFDYFPPSFSDELVELFVISNDFILKLRLILEKQEWEKMFLLRKEMLRILKAMQQYELTLRNNQEEYDLLLKIQLAYQNLIYSMNLLRQNQEQYQQKLENIKTPPVENLSYSLPRLEPKYQPFSSKKEDPDK